MSAAEFHYSDILPTAGSNGAAETPYRLVTTEGVSTVEVNGRATGCHVTRSSRVPELDALTCRLIEQRFRFRPSMDRYGRPFADEVDWDHDWIPPRGGY